MGDAIDMDIDVGSLMAFRIKRNEAMNSLQNIRVRLINMSCIVRKITEFKSPQKKG